MTTKVQLAAVMLSSMGGGFLSVTVLGMLSGRQHGRSRRPGLGLTHAWPPVLGAILCLGAVFDAWMLYAVMHDEHPGIFTDIDNGAKSLAPGIPSLMSNFCFLVLGAAGLNRRIEDIASLLVAVVSLVALFPRKGSELTKCGRAFSRTRVAGAVRPTRGQRHRFGRIRRSPGADGARACRTAPSLSRR